jgi:hypothetical protein
MAEGPGGNAVAESESPNMAVAEAPPQDVESVNALMDEMGVPPEDRGEFAPDKAETDKAETDKGDSTEPQDQSEDAVAKEEVEGTKEPSTSQETVTIKLEDGSEAEVPLAHVRDLASEPASVKQAYEALRATAVKGEVDKTAAVAAYAKLLNVEMPTVAPHQQEAQQVQAATPQEQQAGALPDKAAMVQKELLRLGYSQEEIDEGSVDVTDLKNAERDATIAHQGAVIERWQKQDARIVEEQQANQRFQECATAAETVLKEYGEQAGLHLELPAQREAAKAMIEDATLMGVSMGQSPEVSAAQAMDRLNALMSNTRTISAMKRMARDSRVASVGPPAREATRPDAVTLKQPTDNAMADEELERYLEHVDRTGSAPPIVIGDKT